MKFILRESKIKELLESLLNKISFRVVYDPKEMIYTNGKSLLGYEFSIWDAYLEQNQEPFYVFIFDGYYYIAQFQKHSQKWMIETDEELGASLTPRKMIDKFGLTKFGFTLETLINLKTKNEIF